MQKVMRRMSALGVAGAAVVAIVLGAPAASAAPGDITVPGVSTPGVSVPSTSTGSHTIHTPSLPSVPPVHVGGNASGSAGVG